MWFLVAALAMDPARAQGVPQVSLDDALALAARANPEVRMAEEEVRAARARAAQATTRLLPDVTLEGATLWWDDPLEVRFLDPEETEDLDCTVLPDPYGLLCEGFSEPFVLREEHTRRATATATWPLTGLYGLWEARRAAGLLAQAAEADVASTRAGTAVEVVAAWVDALQARKLQDVARLGVESLESRLDQLQAFEAAGLVGRDQVLQVEVALAEARLGLERAARGQILAERRLALVAGSPEPRLAPVDPLGDGPLPAPPGDFAPPTAHATPERPDLEALAHRQAAAEAGRRARVATLVPQVAAVANWQRTWGEGSFSAPESTYLGLAAQWDVWGWGRNLHEVREAGAEARRAEIGLVALREAAALEADAARTEVALAGQAWEVARVTTTQAEENLRLVSARFDVQMASASDLLEAEALALRARTRRVTAVHDWLLAVARYQQAAGLPVDPLGALREVTP